MKLLGSEGESLAAQFLRKQGYTIIAHNYKTRIGEIDIIARQGEVTIFVEVKTLTSSKNFFPEHNITARKREHMLACAECYTAENAIDHWQIDVIAVEGRQGLEPKITHFENAIT